MPVTLRRPEEVTGVFVEDPANTLNTEREANVSFGETLGASFERENAVSSMGLWLRGYPGAPTREEIELLRTGAFNPLESIKETEFNLPGYLGTVAKARSQRELDWMLKNFREQARNDEVLSRSGTGANITGAIIAGGLDPVMAPMYALPVLRGGMMARSATEGTLAAGAMATSEALLHSTQPARTAEESAMNIGGAAVLGMVLGPLAGRASAAERKAVVNEGAVENAGSSPVLGGSMGAAAVDEVPVSPEFTQMLRDQVEAGEIDNEQAARLLRNEKLRLTGLRRPALMKIFSFASPQLRVATSDNITARNLAEAAFEDPYIREKNEFGHTSGPAAETEARAVRDTATAEIHNVLNDSWAKYKASGAGEITDANEFAEEVWRAWRAGEHADPTVAAAASRVRSDIYAPFEKDLVQQGLIKTDAEGAAKIPFGDVNYAPRIWDFDAITSDRVGFKNAVKSYIRNELAKDGPDNKWMDIADDVDSHLDDVIDDITGAPHAFSFKGDALGLPGHLKARTLNVPTSVIESYLVRDPRDITRAYFNTMSPRLAFQKRFGSWDLKEQIDNVRREYDRVIEAEKPGTRKYRRLTNQANRVIRDLQAMRDITLGTYRRPDDPTSAWYNLGRGVKTLNYVSSLGGMTVASVPDVGQVIARVGFRPFAAGMLKLAAMPKSFGLAKAEAARYAVGLDAVLHSRAHSLTMMDDGYVKTRMADRVAGTFSRWTLMDQWNANLKQFAGVIYMDDLGRLIGRELNTSQRTNMAAAGIDEGMWARIQDQWTAHGDKIDGVRTPNMEAWTDAEAVATLRNAMLKEVDTAVVTPSAGDLPLVSRGPVGQIIFQFKSFAMAAQNRIFLAGLQRADANMVMGWTAMMAIGAAVYGMRQWNRGADISEDWNQVSYEAWVRSGLGGYMGDLDNLAAKLTAGKVTMRIPLGVDEPVSKFAHRSVLNDLLGPTAGRVQDVAKVMSALSKGEIKDSDIRAIRRMIPYQNLFYIRKLLNEVEEAAAEEFAG